MPCFPGGLQGVIFDCDGVMIDSIEANREFYNRILSYYGLPNMTPEEERYAFMATSKQALEHILPVRLHSEIPHLGRDVVNYREEIVPRIKIFPGFLAFTAFLHEHGVKMAVLTNRTQAGMQTILDFFSLPPYLYPVVTASSGFCKPRPEGALSILSTWSRPPEDVLYVGDSEIDCQTAAAAGVPFAALQAPQRTALAGKFHVHDYESLRRELRPYISPKNLQEPRNFSCSSSPT